MSRTLEVLEAVFGDRYLRDFDVRLWDGTTQPSRTAKRNFTFVVNSPGALRNAFVPPVDLNAGTALVDGSLDIEGDVFAAVAAISDVGEKRSTLQTARAALLLARLPREPRPAAPHAHLNGKLHSRERDRAAISYHYDHPVDFYAAFLDRDLVYSCAYYDDGIDDVDRAQSAKLDHVLRKLRLREGMSFLDIGCGWGSLVIRAAQYGAKALGITLSRVQYETANRRIEQLGLSDRARVELRDYRELGNAVFDRIASVGMVEHVGRSHLPEYFSAAFEALRAGGLFLNHGITEQSPGRTYKGNGFIERYVFPDGGLQCIGDILGIAERRGFEVRDIENLREHYARTLRAWVQNIERNREAAESAAGVTAYRVWRLYMAASAVNFERGNIAVFQSLLAKPDADGRVDIPMTRRDLYDYKNASTSESELAI
jgi:cyclopropane-fatty-acyl-phospholipid synthase